MNSDNDTPPAPHQTAATSRTRRVLERLGWFYGIALAVGLIALWGFGLLANGVMHESFTDFNRGVMLAVHEQRSPALDSVALAASSFGSVVPTGIIVLLFGIIFLLRRRRLDAIALGAVVVGSVLLMVVLKATFQQIRPQVFPPLALETSFSFPSGHTLTAFCIWGFVASWIVREGPRELWRWIAALPFPLLASVVALSRIYLGVHWPTDVAAGILVAIFWTTACLTGQEWATRRGRLRGLNP